MLSVGCFIGALGFLIGFRRLFRRFMRKCVVHQAVQYGPQVWEIAAKFQLGAPPTSELGTAPQVRINLPFEGKQRVALDGQWVTIEYSGCLTHTQGDFTGNLDVAVRSSPPLDVESIVENLKLKVPGYVELLDVLAWEKVENQVEVIFGLSDLTSVDVDYLVDWERRLASSLRDVELWWGKPDSTKLGTISCKKD